MGSGSGLRMSSRQAALVGLILVWVLTLGLSSSARADFEIKNFDGRVSKADRVTPETQAGAHPYQVAATMSFDGEPFEDPKDIVVDVPPGLVGNPNATPFCARKQFVADVSGCPPETQVGLLTSTARGSVVTYGVFA
jgi:hypothetical protein